MPVAETAIALYGLYNQIKGTPNDWKVTMPKDTAILTYKLNEVARESKANVIKYFGGGKPDALDKVKAVSVWGIAARKAIEKTGNYSLSGAVNEGGSLGAVDISAGSIGAGAGAAPASNQSLALLAASVLALVFFKKF